MTLENNRMSSLDAEWSGRLNILGLCGCEGRPARKTWDAIAMLSKVVGTRALLVKKKLSPLSGWPLPPSATAVPGVLTY